MLALRESCNVFALIFLITVASGNFLNLAGLKNSLFNWTNSQSSTCTGNNAKLLNLINLVCSTAQASNTTVRDACYGCFARFSSLPQGQQQLIALNLCANTYFSGTSYGACATRLNTLVTGNTPVSTSNQCSSPYCEFVRCLRRTNSNNLIIQCAAEVQSASAINITLDNDNVRYYTNLTSCILAKTRCASFNPITGDIQTPGMTSVNNGKIRSQVPVFNSVQIASDATLRILSFPGTAINPTLFCSDKTTLAQTKWSNNEC